MYEHKRERLQTGGEEPPQQGRGWSGLLAIAAVALALVGFAQSVMATPKLCVPFAQGVPYWQESPNWWTSYTDQERERLSKAFDPDVRRTNDPRWRGALSIDYGAGATDPAEFRALYDSSSQSLLLSWSSKTMDFVNEKTSVVVGIKFGNNAPIVVRTRIKTTSTIDSATGEVAPRSGSQNAFDSSTFQQSGSDWVSATAPPWAASETRVWVMPSQGSGAKPAFTLQMRIPTAGATTFRLWQSIQLSVPATDDTNPTDPASYPRLVAYTWPRGAVADWAFYDQEQPSGGYKKHVPAVSSWGEFQIGSPPMGATPCAGVTLADSDIGVYNGQNGDRSRISIHNTNRFYSLPQRIDSTPGAGNLDLSGVKATFYFANWGSQRGTLTGSSWSTLGSQLNDRPPVTVTNANQRIDTSWLNQSTPSIADNPAQVAPQQKAQIEAQWTLSKVDKCKFFVEGSASPKFLAEESPNGSPGFCTGEPTPPTINPHGCMMVKLNGPVEFLKDSALTNMQFAPASIFSRSAEISSAPGPRNVYLFVDRRNMPTLRGSGAADVKAAANASLALKPIPISGKLKEIHQMLSRGIHPRLPYEDLAAIMPTYVVHAFHDGGQKIMIDGIPHIPLDQQTSFGYFVWHEGPLYDWNVNLTGATPLRGDSVYKVAVPDGGAVKIATKIEAVETAEPPPPCKCNCGDFKCKVECNKLASNGYNPLAASLALVGTLGIGGFAFKRRRRSDDLANTSDRKNWH